MEETIKLSAKAIWIAGVFLSGFFLGSTRMQAQQSEACPWLNRATVAGVLGGEVRVAVTHPAMDQANQRNGAAPDATCEFTLSNGTSDAVLRVVVHTMQDHGTGFKADLAMCGSSGHPLIGVGNEATACEASKDSGDWMEQVIGRVRERTFGLSLFLSKQDGNRDKNERQAAKDKVQNIAAQVAGSLF